MNQRQFLQVVQETVLSERLLERGQGVVVGVSGGPDSMALLHVLLALDRQHDWGWTLHVAHLNHGLRGRAGDEDEQFVRAAADELRLPCMVKTTAVEAVARDRRQSVEEAARQCRYEFFERVALQTQSRSVAVAHHADDDAETIVHRIARGTGFRGLAGIPITRPIRSRSDVRLVRPLLRVRRADIEGFMKERKHAFRIDATNLAGENTRSRIRQTVLPVLEEQVHAGAVDALLRLAEQARWMAQFLQQAAEQAIGELTVTRDERQCVLDGGALLAQPRIIQAEAIRQVAFALSGPQATAADLPFGRQEMGLEQLKSVLRLIEENQTGKRLMLPGGVSARIEYDRLVLERALEQPTEPATVDVILTIPGRTELPERRLEIVAELHDYAGSSLEAIKANQDSQTQWLDFDRIYPPMVVRSPQRGDRFSPLGAGGSKKLSDFFVDSKVPRSQRLSALVLCDREGIVWLIGHRLDDRAKVTAETRRVLKVQVRALATDAGSAEAAGLDPS